MSIKHWHRTAAAEASQKCVLQVFAILGHNTVPGVRGNRFRTDYYYRLLLKNRLLQYQGIHYIHHQYYSYFAFILGWFTVVQLALFLQTSVVEGFPDNASCEIAG